MDVDIKGWTFTHWWVRPVVKVWFNRYHKSVSYSGTENIDWQKPIIFAPSHQNAFSDALCLILPTQYTNNRFIYPLIRADAFGNNKMADWILTAFHMMPVYRPRDDVKLRQRNESVFAHCHEILAKNRNLLIHPEGNCIARKKVRSFKKGLARIALGAEAQHNFNLGVTVVPVGINYRQITEARKGIHIRYGQAIPVGEYKNTYREHGATAITELTREVERSVRDITVDIGTDYQTTERFIRIAKSRKSDIDVSQPYSKDELAFEKEVVCQLADMQQADGKLPEKKTRSVNTINTLLQKHKLDLDYPLAELKSTARIIFEGLAYVMLLPVFLYGWINNIIPWLLIHKIADMIKDEQFKSSVRMASGLLIFPFCYILQGGVIGFISGSWEWSLIYLLSVPFAGLISLNIAEKWKAWRQQLRLKIMPRSEKADLFDLIDRMFEMVKAKT